MGEWDVFQRDVLDVLKQYEGFFDFFERVGSLSDKSRPDGFARISRENKKEIWILDAKNKNEISEEDEERMDKYTNMVKSNPIDVGLEISEISEYDIKGIFITKENTKNEKYKTVGFKQLHQFLQRELLYNNMDKVIRDISKMLDRRQLSQSQARLLYRSLEPYQNKIKTIRDHLSNLETKYLGLKYLEPPLKEFEYNVPVDAILKHTKREKAFLIDVPYSQEELKKTEKKVDQVKETLKDIEDQIYYSALNTLDNEEKKFIYQPENLEPEIKRTAGIISPDEIANLFRPKIKTEKRFEDKYVEIEDKKDLGFLLRVKSKNDIRHQIEISLPKNAISRVKENQLNSLNEFVTIHQNRIIQEIKVTEDLEIQYGDNQVTYKDYKDKVNSIYSSAVNPVLSKKIAKKIK